MAFAILEYFRIPVLVSSCIAALASSILYIKQNDIIYQRNLPIGSRSDVDPPYCPEIAYEYLNIATRDGEQLTAYLLRPLDKRQRNVTILMFHGNAGNVMHRFPIARELLDTNDCNVLMLEYRGYGSSTGTPSEEGLMLDAQAGLDYLLLDPELKRSKIVVYGQSIGGAVGIRLVEKNQNDVAGLILENTFLSIPKLIPSVFPLARYLTFLCHQIWPNEDTLPKIKKIPILFLSGLQDEIVPSFHMRTLYDICVSKHKVWKDFPLGQHNDCVADPLYFGTIVEFININIKAQGIK